MLNDYLLQSNLICFADESAPILVTADSYCLCLPRAKLPWQDYTHFEVQSAELHIELRPYFSRKLVLYEFSYVPRLIIEAMIAERGILDAANT